MTNNIPEEDNVRNRYAVFFNAREEAILAKIMDEMGRYGVKNRSQAIRVALYAWDDAFTDKLLAKYP